MLHLKTLPHLHRSLLSFPKFPKLQSLSHPSHSRRLPFSIPTMSTTVATTSTVEHVVLFQVKPTTDPSLVDAMISNLNSLSSLDHVSHLTCTPVLRHRSSAARPFTHLLHGRYPSKPDLASYSAHPSHVSVVRNFVLPICDDIMALDWVANLDPVHVPLAPGSAVRLTFVKLKDDAGEEGKGEILSALAEIGGIVGVQQVSFGENFSPGRSKGYSIAMLAVIDGVEGLERLDGAGEEAEVLKAKVRGLLESVIVLDFILPAAAASSASL